jgi:hypothetical protein
MMVAFVYTPQDTAACRISLPADLILVAVFEMRCFQKALQIILQNSDAKKAYNFMANIVQVEDRTPRVLGSEDQRCEYVRSVDTRIGRSKR